MKIFVDENELACDSSDSDTNFGTIGHDSSSEFEEETQAGPATWLPQSNTAGSRVISFKGFIFHFSSQQNPGHSHHRFDAAICCNSRHRHFQKIFSVYFNIRGLTAKVFDVLHTVALTMSLWGCNAVGRISLSCSSPV